MFDAIVQEIGDPPSDGLFPPLVNTIEARHKVRKIIETRFPGLSVLCYQELPTDLSVAVIARISFQR